MAHDFSRNIGPPVHSHVDLPAPTNEPINLYQPAFTLIQLREVELQNLQHRIEDVTRRPGRAMARSGPLLVGGHSSRFHDCGFGRGEPRDRLYDLPDHVQMA
jgi:hypothetical protein